MSIFDKNAANCRKSLFLSGERASRREVSGFKEVILEHPFGFDVSLSHFSLLKIVFFSLRVCPSIETAGLAADSLWRFLLRCITLKCTVPLSAATMLCLFLPCLSH